MTQDKLLKLIDQAAEKGWTRLNLAGKNLTELPRENCKLTWLKKLISGKRGQENKYHLDNQLSTLPAEIGQLSNLQELDLSNNQLSALPAEIGQLINLRKLDLSNNQLSALPIEIGQLINLQKLNLRYNQLSALPAEIGQLTKLQKLNLRYNQLSVLPIEIGQLINLQKLDLSYSEFSALPVEIGQLTKLQKLYLNSSQLSALPIEIGQLINLQHLDLGYNRLSVLPIEIGQLINLQQLYLSFNQLSVLLAEIGQLINLQHLDFRSNQLSELPAEIGQLINLQHLDLTSNQLSALPAEIGQLINLQHLYLSSNQLSELLAEIGQLTNLQHLYLRYHQLIELPAEIGKLSNLRQLDLSYHHDLQDPPPEIVESGTQDILSYLRQKLEQGLDRLYEAKFLIVGEGGAGKTSLAKKILDSNYDLNVQEASTEGIEVMRWDFKLRDGKDFRANIWDFGGQEIYHATHQFFLTKRSLYVLVVDTRQDNTDLYYWLSVVELLSKGSPVFIVKNEKQDRQCEVNERQLRGEFNNLKETLATNLKTNRGLEDIKTRIQHYISTLPHVGAELPKKWVDVRRVLEANPNNYIALAEYINICNTNGFTAKTDQLQLSEYLHDLGVCLHFQQDPVLRNTVILKPEWGTDAVYKVLGTKAIRDNQGRFNRKQLDHIWHESEYADMRDELLQLMIRFKLCYLIPGTKDQYIAPQLLAADSPVLEWNKRNNLVLRYHYTFMPKGILTRFIVEMHKFIEEQRLVWKTGVVLTNGSARAEVIELYHKGEIHIRVSGTLPRDLLSVVTHEIDQINASYERIQVDKQIPCTCSLCAASEPSHFFPLDILKRSLGKSSAVQCPESFEMVDGQQLIHGIGDYIIYDRERGDVAVATPTSLSRQAEAKKDAWPTQKLDPIKRLKLFKTLQGLSSGELEQVIFALTVPKGILGNATAPQGERVASLLNWAESPNGCGLPQLESILQMVIAG